MFNSGYPKNWSTLKRLAWLYRTVINAVVAVLKTVTGNPIHILDALAKPVQALSVKLEPVQAGSGDPSPDNVRPISGHTDADVTRTGKNMLDKAKAVLYNNVPRFIKYGVDNYADTLPNGDCVLDAGTYTFSISGDGTENPASMIAYDSSGNRLAIIYNNKSLTFTTASAGACYLSINFADAVTWADYNIQLELGSTATDYEEYRGTTYPIPLGQTVYGGTLEYVRNGDSVSLRFVADMAIVDLGTLNWDRMTDRAYPVFRPTAAIENMKPYPTGTPNIISSRYPCIAEYYYNDFGDSDNDNKLAYIRLGGQANKIAVQDSAYTTAAAFKTAMSGVQLCYELSEPVIIPLTLDTPIELLEGENNIWSDGEMTLVYLADGNASDEEALNILLGGRYVNNHEADEPTDREALQILLGGNR